MKTSKKKVKTAMRAQISHLNKSDLADVAALTQYLAAPMSFEAIRYPDTYSTFRTSLSTPWVRNDASFNGTTSSLYLFRQPLRAYIQSVSVTASGSGGDFIGYSSAPSGEDGCDGYYGPLGSINTNTALTSSPHGLFLYPGTIGSNFYYYVEKGQVVTGTFSVATTTAGVVTVVSYEQLGTITRALAVPSGSTSFTYTVGDRGYYSFQIQPGLTTSVGLKVAYPAAVTNQLVYGHHALPGIDDLIDAISSIRLTAVSGMYTNYASVLNLQGRGVGYQAPGSTEWWDWTTFASVAGAEAAYTATIKEGMYGFLKPNKSNDMDFRAVLTNTFPCFDLNAENDFLVLLQDISNVDGQEGFYTISYGLEFRTANTWWGTSVERPLMTVLNEVLPILANMDQFHDNPIHLKDIGNFVKKVVGAVVKYGPIVLKTAGALAALL